MRTRQYRDAGLPAELSIADVLSRPTAAQQLPIALAADTDPYPGANKTERRYCLHLTRLQSADQIARWWWKPGSLRIAPSLHYQPDMLVQSPDGVLEIHDVKGAKGERFWVEEDAWVKLKTVARLYPYRVVVVWEKRGEWRREVIGAASEAA